MRNIKGCSGKIIGRHPHIIYSMVQQEIREEAKAEKKYLRMLEEESPEERNKREEYIRVESRRQIDKRNLQYEIILFGFSLSCIVMIIGMYFTTNTFEPYVWITMYGCAFGSGLIYLYQRSKRNK